MAGGTGHDVVGEWLRRRPRRSAGLPAVDRSRPLPASDAQQRIWLDHQLRVHGDPDGGTVYHSVLGLRLRHEPDAHAVQSALGALLARHEVLRTVYATAADGSLLQVIAADRVVDLRTGSYHAAAAFFREPFDLAHGPVLRAGLFRAGAEDWRLLLVIHHIATDGWSMDILHRELGELYAAACDGRSPQLPSKTSDFADFAAWEQERRGLSAYAREMAFWRTALAGADPVLSLPADRRPGTRTYDAGSVRTVIPASVTAAVEQVAWQVGATTYQVMLAAFRVVLTRWCGHHDVVVGTPAANRLAPGTEAIVGPFVNLLPLRDPVDELEPFVQLVERTRETVLEAFDNQGLSFHRIVEELVADRAPGAAPLVQAVFAAEEPEPTVGERFGERVPFENAFKTQFDLVAGVRTDGAGGLLLDIGYAADVLDAGAVDRFAARFVAFLEQAVMRPQAPLLALATLTPAETAQLEGFATGLDAPAPVLVTELFDRQVREHPDEPAVAEGTVELSYRKLDERVDLLTRLIQAHGVEPGAPVGVCMTRSAWQVAALLAVGRAGAAYLPLDAGYPDQRLDHLLADSGASLVLQDAAAARGRQWPTGVELVNVESVHAHGAAAAVRIHPKQTACLIYTSGSTGRPKGVLVPHAGLGNFVSWYADHYDLGPGDRLPQTASPGFDAGLLDTLPALAAGACLVILPDEARLDAGRLFEQLADRGTTAAFLTTPLYSAAVAEGPPIAAAPRTVQVGGDRLAQVSEGLPFRLDNLYGPTETTIAATCGEQTPGRPPHIGRPLRGMRVRVLDDWLRPVPAGTEGELYISGPGVATGYRNLPGLTAARFLPDPWAADGTRMYRTGDRARVLPDGRLEFLGRRDSQVKVRGYRIELGEIETVLAAHPDVLEAVADVRQDAGEDRTLAAYVRLAPAGSVTSLRRHVERLLPHWLQPAAYIVVDRIPLTVNGKLDRKQAARLAAAAPQSQALPVAATSAALRQVLQAWEQVLGAPVTDADTGFFALGGTSSGVLRVLTALRATYPAIQPADLFRHTTARTLAAHLEGTTDHPVTAPEPADNRGAVRAQALKTWHRRSGSHAR